MPRTGGPAVAARLLALQRTAGNRAVGSLLRCKCGADGGGAGSAVAPASGGSSSAKPPTKKTVTIYPMTLGSSLRNPYRDIERADEIWSQCGVKIKSMIGQCSTSKVLDTLDPKDVLNEYSDPASPTSEETAMLALQPGGSSALHAYYVPKMSANSRGEAFWPAVSKTSAVVISDSAASDSLAHEIGHVLLDRGAHNEVDPDDLMAAGRIRNVGVDKLNATQCAKAVS
jgi:hypothetical protein